MQKFTELFLRLDQSNKTNAKIEALKDFFASSSDQDKLWCIALLAGNRPKRSIRSADLRRWTAELSGFPDWLFEETYHVVGDLAETISKILPETQHNSGNSLDYWMKFILELSNMEYAQKRDAVLKAWRKMSSWERFVFNKMMMGGFRIGVSQKTLLKALALYTGKQEAELAHRLMGNWNPRETSFQKLLLDDHAADDLSRPYPFFLAYQLEDINKIGEPHQWIAEKKWDGIRGQLILRGGKHYLWSRGEELINDKFPEFSGLLEFIPEGTVIDGEILAFRDGQILPFQNLQPRIGRKNVTKKILKEAPAIIRAYDLLEWKGKDIREFPQEKRRELLVSLINSAPENPLIQLSEAVNFNSWQELAAIRETSREHRCEGIMLKKKDGKYQAGRKKGDWWKWKVDPLTIDAVMIYAMRGHGRRANLYTDYTFAVWNGDELVPFTKAYSGLTDTEFRQIDQFVKRNTRERFGPVRSVNPELVFELAFEGIQKSARHKSGVALRFPRMKRWRQDKPAREANTLNDLRVMLNLYGT